MPYNMPSTLVVKSGGFYLHIANNRLICDTENHDPFFSQSMRILRPTRTNNLGSWAWAMRAL